MTFVDLPVPVPGITKLDSDYGSSGRWVDGDKVRFVGLHPEKVGGCERLLSTAVTGTCRGLHPWRDNDEFRRLGIGTHKKLQIYSGGALTDITPKVTVATTTLTDPFTTNGTVTVTVADTAHGQITGDNVVFNGATAVGGITIQGPYTITKIDADSYTITHSEAASSSTTGGGSVSRQKFRGSLTNPFTTTNGSATVTVTHASHGRSVNDYVNFSGASAVGGITVDGEYVVASVVDASNYTITHSAAATSGATGGGTVTYRYDVSVGLLNSIGAAGYGVGGYGSGTYGSPRSVTVTLAARVWSLDHFGQKLVANPRGGDLYEWDPDQGGHATPVPNAPTSNVGMYVTEERICVLLGADGDKLAVARCAQEDLYTWAASATNTASDAQLNAGNEIIGGGKVRASMSLIHTDTACFIDQYTGDDFVFGNRLAGDKCGLVGQAATVELGGIRYWMSDSDFWMFDGTVPRKMPSDDIRAYVFGDINMAQRAKFWAWANALHNEIWFFYCSAASDEVDSYVAVRLTDFTWVTGTWARTAGVDRSIFSLPILAGSDDYLYNHETGVDDNGAAMHAFVTSAPADIEDGNVNLDISGIIPDFGRIAGTVNIYVLTRPYPAGALTSNGPYAATSATDVIDVRADGRQAALKFDSNEIGGDFRLGKVRANADAQGGR